ncbi:MAG: phosphatase PAP2 family protein [Actinomycetota bacterium]
MEGVTAPEAPVPAREHRVHWWKEALIVGVFYVVYSAIRNQFGSNRIAADGVPEQAFHNAERIIQIERAIGTFHEESIQELFLSQRWFIQFWNVYYGTAHFFVTLGVFILLFLKRRDVFPQWRNTLAAMTGLAIVGFAFFPLMPPRLLDAPCPIPTGDYAIEVDASAGAGGGDGDDAEVDEPINTQFGGACVPSSLRSGKEKTFTGDNGFGFVDTIKVYGGPWAFDSEAVASISNQYAAMPSMHIGWSTWSALAVWPLLRKRWLKALVLLYPAATLFCIVVTGNHYWIDGLGGLLAFAIGAVVGWGLHRWNQNRLDRKYGYPAERLMGFRDVAGAIVDDVSTPSSPVGVTGRRLGSNESDAAESTQRAVGDDRAGPGGTPD